MQDHKPRALPSWPSLNRRVSGLRCLVYGDKPAWPTILNPYSLDIRPTTFDSPWLSSYVVISIGLLLQHYLAPFPIPLLHSRICRNIIPTSQRDPPSFVCSLLAISAYSLILDFYDKIHPFLEWTVVGYAHWQELQDDAMDARRRP